MKKKFPQFLRHSHTPQSIRKRLSGKKQEVSIKDFVYGVVDGIITTFAIIMSVKGAELSHGTVLIMGTANLLADGFSMATGAYLSTKAEQDERELIKQFEENQIKENPEGEIAEIREIFINKGFTGKLLDDAIKVTIKDRERWINMMINEEFGMIETARSPVKVALVTICSFVFFGMIPLLPFFLNLDKSFLYACILTAIAFLSMGMLKSKWSMEAAWISGAKTLLVGSVAAAIAYGVGRFLKDIV